MSASPEFEIWKDIPGFEGFYQASTHGQVRSLPRQHQISIKGTQAIRSIKGRMLRPNVHKKTGYATVFLSRPGLKKSYLIHRLILKTFIGPPEDKQEGCHGNGIRTDNRLENLRWDTKKGNHADMIIHGTRPLGSARHNKVLTEAQVLEIYWSDKTGADLSREFGIATAHVSNIRLGQIWKSVTGGVPRPQPRRGNPFGRLSKGEKTYGFR